MKPKPVENSSDEEDTKSGYSSDKSTSSQAKLVSQRTPADHDTPVPRAVIFPIVMKSGTNFHIIFDNKENEQDFLRKAKSCYDNIAAEKTRTPPSPSGAFRSIVESVILPNSVSIRILNHEESVTVCCSPTVLQITGYLGHISINFQSGARTFHECVFITEDVNSSYLQYGGRIGYIKLKLAEWGGHFNILEFVKRLVTEALEELGPSLDEYILAPPQLPTPSVPSGDLVEIGDLAESQL